jgi:hypothetical protein
MLVQYDSSTFGSGRGVGGGDNLAYKFPNENTEFHCIKLKQLARATMARDILLLFRPKYQWVTY